MCQVPWSIAEVEDLIPALKQLRIQVASGPLWATILEFSHLGCTQGSATCQPRSTGHVTWTLSALTSSSLHNGLMLLALPKLKGCCEDQDR